MSEIADAIYLNKIQEFIKSQDNGRLSMSYDSELATRYDGALDETGATRALQSGDKWELRLIVGRGESRRVMSSYSPTLGQCLREIAENMQRLSEVGKYHQAAKVEKSDDE
jgi:hypothetical protein